MAETIHWDSLRQLYSEAYLARSNKFVVLGSPLINLEFLMYTHTILDDDSSRKIIINRSHNFYN